MMNEEPPLPHAFDRDAVVEIAHRKLPHWRQEGVVYFVTFRLADSLPSGKLAIWRQERDEWLTRNPLPHTPEQHRKAVKLWEQRVNEWLDAGHGSCCLGEAAAGEAVEKAMRHFEGERYLLGDYVVMPNHVHALLIPINNHALSEILHSWKLYASHEIARLRGRGGKLWQEESFDHIVRDEESWVKFARYIRQNPKCVPIGRARAGCGRLRCDVPES